MVEATGFEPTTSWSRTMRATNCATPRKRYSVYVLWSRVAPTVSAAVRECSRLGHRSGDLMPSLISLGKTAGDRCFEDSSLVLMSRTMRSDLLRYASKKIFSLCFMVAGCTHGLGGSKGMQPPRSPLGRPDALAHLARQNSG